MLNPAWYKFIPGWSIFKLVSTAQYQGISSYIILSVFFHQSGMARAGPKKL